MFHLFSNFRAFFSFVALELLKQLAFVFENAGAGATKEILE